MFDRSMVRRKSVHISLDAHLMLRRIRSVHNFNTSLENLDIQGVANLAVAKLFKDLINGEIESLDDIIQWSDHVLIDKEYKEYKDGLRR